MTATAISSFPRAGFRRRFGAWVYDTLLAFAVYMIAGALSFALFNLAIYFKLVSMQGFEHAIDLQQASLLYSGLIYLWNIAWVGFFFVWFWSRSGQTLGMKAWRLRIQNADGSLISKKCAIKRLFVGLLGLGNFLVLFDRKNKLGLADRLTNTEIVVLSLQANRGRL